MQERDVLINYLGEAGVSDRYYFIGGIRGKVADLIVAAVKAKTHAVVQEYMLKALDVARTIAKKGASDETNTEE